MYIMLSQAHERISLEDSWLAEPEKNFKGGQARYNKVLKVKKKKDIKQILYFLN